MAQRNNNSKNNGNNKSQVVFLNTLLKNDGDTVIVRFPYKSFSDIKIDKCHSVQFPGDMWAKKVRCSGDDNCPLCKSGNKTTSRFFAKMLVYTPQADGSVLIQPAIWDRPSAFVDVELSEKIRECEEDELGTLADNIIKVRRVGVSGNKDTRYTLSITHNKSIYNPDVYKADFSCLDDIDPSRILTKSIEKYLEVFSGAVSADTTTTTPVEDVKSNIVRETPATALSRPSYNFQPETPVLTTVGEKPSTPEQPRSKVVSASTERQVGSTPQYNRTPATEDSSSDEGFQSRPKRTYSF